MGLANTVIALDAAPGLSCPAGHVLRSFQTKDLDHSSMATYLVHRGRLFLAGKGGLTDECDETVSWRIQGNMAIREHHYSLREVQPPQAMRVYGRCYECDPVLVRCDDTTFLGDLVQEHALFVDFRLTFRAGEPVQIERESGSRAELREDLRRRGVYVLEDNEPLAVAHRENERVRSRSRR